jgi:hypothetical protein
MVDCRMPIAECRLFIVFAIAFRTEICGPSLLNTISIGKLRFEI